MYNTLAKKLKWLNSDTLINHLFKNQIHIICTWSFQSSLSVTDVEYLWMAPVCNRDVLKKHSEHQKEEEIPSVIELANCGLHIQFMMSCKLEPLSLLAIFTNFFLWCGKCLTSHQPEEISISETSCDVFPVHFCKTIWVEDGPVASQTIGIWQCVTVVKKYWLSLSKSKQLKNNKFFDTLVKHHKDQLIIAKLQFLRGCLHVKFVTGMKSSLSIVKCLLPFTRFCRDERRGEISSRDEKKKKRRVDTSCRDEILK